MTASINGHTDVVQTVVQTLIEAKAQIDTQKEVCCSYHQKKHHQAVLGEVTVCLCPQDGWTALHAAAHEGKVDVVRLLTEAQALVNIRTEVRHL